MMKTVKQVAFTALKLGVVFGIVYWSLALILPESRRDVAKTGEIITGADKESEQFEWETREHKTQTETKVVVIREQVRSEVLALDADGLAVAALAEIELWRGSSGDNTPARSSGMDGGGGGVFPERGSAVEPDRRREDIPP